jgi:uroporphyrin-III C-methyltransferase
MNTQRSGRVYFVGAGPGDPELLTLKAHALLKSADLVLHDDLVPPAIVSLAGPRAMSVNVGKRCGAKRITQSEINRLMIASAKRGESVVRLKSGDPGIFGRLAEELDALEAAGVAFEIVPGVTAGIGAAAALGVSLTDRRKSSRLVIVSGHHASEKQPEPPTDWAGLAREDTTLVIYMPGRDFAKISSELMRAGLPAATPSVVVARATTPEQHEIVTTLGELGAVAGVKAPSILLIGRALERAAARAGAGASQFVPTSEWRSLIDEITQEISPAASSNNSERRITS